MMIDAFVLFLLTSEISISYNEALLLDSKNFSVLQLLIKSSMYLLGNHDFALRLPMIVMHLISVFLLYEISKHYLSRKSDRIWLIVFYILLPGVISSALVVNSAGMVIVTLFLLIYLHDKITDLILLCISLPLLFVDISFVSLYLGLGLYYLQNKKKSYFIISVLIFIYAVYYYRPEVYGVPKGHFLDTIGIYATIFTPIVFIFIFYTLYRRFLTNKKDLIFYLSSVTLIISLFLSFRQRISVEHFAPYLMVSLPLAAQTFSNSYRVRLKIFRKRYKAIFILSIVLLLLNSLVVLFNKELYMIIDNPKKHFAYKSHIAKELSQELKKRGIKCVQTNKEMTLRLQFYGIYSCSQNILHDNSIYLIGKVDNVTVSYNGVVVYSGYVTKINNH